MAEGETPQERRGRPRVTVGGNMVANVQTVLQAPIIDLSATGALVEIEEALRPGSRCTVRLPVGAGQPLRVTARVARSLLVSLAREGGGAARYRVALAFVDLSAEAISVLNDHLDRVHGAVSAEILKD